MKSIFIILLLASYSVSLCARVKSQWVHVPSQVSDEAYRAVLDQYGRDGTIGDIYKQVASRVNDARNIDAVQDCCAIQGCTISNNTNYNTQTYEYEFQAVCECKSPDGGTDTARENAVSECVRHRD
ncbi:MAG: hypothetical protein HOE90_01395 [Bacteriovoracaceae bacterium]|jgi:hypothetical protein|nr:hypothetical protein [Bacteriovoracaceae bacterium]